MDPEAFPIQLSDIISTECLGSASESPPRWRCLERLPREVSRRRRPSPIQLSMRGAAALLWVPSRMSELLILSLKMRLAPLQRKFISVPCVCLFFQSLNTPLRLSSLCKDASALLFRHRAQLSLAQTLETCPGPYPFAELVTPDLWFSWQGFSPGGWKRFASDVRDRLEFVSGVLSAVRCAALKKVGQLISRLFSGFIDHFVPKMS